MSYEPVCQHENVNIEWKDIEALKAEGIVYAANSEYMLFIGDKVHIGRAHCNDCRGFLNDHDPAAIAAFDKLLSVKSKQELRARRYAAQALVRN